MKFFQAALLAAAAEARFNQFQSIVDALMGRSGNTDPIRQRVPSLYQASPGIADTYDSVDGDFTWTYKQEDSTAVKSYKDSAVQPESPGVSGTWTMEHDSNGVNWFKVDLETGWTKEVQSSNKFNTYYVGMMWFLAGNDDVTLNNNSITINPGKEVEVAIQGAKRNPSDNPKSDTSALSFDSLEQWVTGFQNEDLGKEGSAIFAGDINTDVASATAWQNDEVYSLQTIQGNKKYIHGMQVQASRPFVSTSSRNSSLTIKNQEDYVFCATTWIANKNVNVQYNKGCGKVTVDLPVPVIVDPEPEDPTDPVPDDTTNDDNTGSGASALTLTAVAAMTIAALAF